MAVPELWTLGISERHENFDHHPLCFGCGVCHSFVCWHTYRHYAAYASVVCGLVAIDGTLGAYEAARADFS